MRSNHDIHRRDIIAWLLCYVSVPVCSQNTNRRSSVQKASNESRSSSTHHDCSHWHYRNEVLVALWDICSSDWIKWCRSLKVAIDNWLRKVESSKITTGSIDWITTGFNCWCTNSGRARRLLHRMWNFNMLKLLWYAIYSIEVVCMLKLINNTVAWTFKRERKRK